MAAFKPHEEAIHYLDQIFQSFFTCYHHVSTRQQLTATLNYLRTALGDPLNEFDRDLIIVRRLLTHFLDDDINKEAPDAVLLQFQDYTKGLLRYFGDYRYGPSGPSAPDWLITGRWKEKSTSTFMPSLN